MPKSGPLSETIRYVKISGKFGGSAKPSPAKTMLSSAKNGNKPHLDNLLPEAMVKLVCNSGYDFGHEQLLWDLRGLPPAYANFRSYFIGIYSGRTPTKSNILFTPHNIATAPLDPETGAFKSDEFKMGMIWQIRESKFKIHPSHVALFEAVEKQTQRAKKADGVQPTVQW